MRSEHVSDEKTVWLDDAWLLWRCPNCAKSNKCRWIGLEIPSEVLDEMREDGEAVWETTFDERMPYKVRCRACRRRFGVANHAEEEYDEHDV